MKPKNYTPSNSSGGLLVILLILSIVIPLCYSLYTNEIWEDSLITFRYSKNLINGNGLVYNVGERVHGFTSPLGMFLLALCYLITNKTSEFYVFLLYRFICFIAFTTSCFYLVSVFSDEDKRGLMPFLLGVLYIFDAKSISFIVNGMETAFMLFFLAVYIFVIYKNFSGRWLLGGICWAGLMWTRPDGCVYIGALSIAHIFCSGLPKKENLIGHLKMALICTALYLPWFVFAWSYFGSPIPQTILAKLHYPVFFPLPVKIRLLLDQVPGPIYYNSIQRSWPPWIEGFFLTATIFAIFYWLLPLKDKFIKIISLSCFLVFLYYLFFMNMFFPWHFPPLKMMSSVVLIKGLFDLMRNRGKILAFVILMLFCCTSIYVFALSATQRRIYQSEIEEGNRKLIGLWLKNNARMSDRVFLEPFGYIGYFSEVKIVDYPGLVSPEIVRLMDQDKDLTFYTLVPKVQPEWLVLRGHEVRALLSQEYFKKDYSMVKIFNVKDRLRKYKDISGIEAILFDASFVIFKKTGNTQAK